MNKEPITLEGHERLKEEIHRLKTKERPRIIKAIAEARAHGDLKENAEYHAAREEQGLLEARIAELENTLALAQVIDHKALSNGHIAFGATVTLLDLQTSQQKKYQIVGSEEADMAEGKISNKSPFGQALLGRKKGDDILFKTPSGAVNYKIINVS